MQRPGPPIIIGGGGPKRTPRLAARYAAEFNLPFAPSSDDRAAVRPGRGPRARRSGRDPARMRLLRPPRSSAAARTTPRWPGGPRPSAGTSTSCARNGLAGTPAEVVDKIGRLRRGRRRALYLQVLDLADLDHLELLAGLIS